jgi:hypothetical protein
LRFHFVETAYESEAVVRRGTVHPVFQPKGNNILLVPKLNLSYRKFICGVADRQDSRRDAVSSRLP